MTLNDPLLVRAEYATERGLEGRRAAYRYGTGQDASRMAFEAAAEVSPRRVLEVRCGPGELSARRDEVVGYVESSRMLFGPRAELPAFDGELVVTRHSVVFVAHTA